MGYMDIAKKQEAVPLSHIAHGTEIPPGIFDRYVHPRSILLDLGGAGGDFAGQIKGLYPDRPVYYLGLDINPPQVNLANTEGYFSFVADATDPEVPALADRHTSLWHKFDAVVAKALLCNLTGLTEEDSAKAVRKALLTAALYLDYTTGHLIIADMNLIRFDDNPLRLWECENIFYNHQAHIRKWMQRYHNNALAGLPYGTFVVTEPNDKRKQGDAEVLKKLLRTGEYERLARHFRRGELVKLLHSCGFEVVQKLDSVCFSRSGNPLSQCTIVARLRRNIIDYPNNDGHQAWVLDELMNLNGVPV